MCNKNKFPTIEKVLGEQIPAFITWLSDTSRCTLDPSAAVIMGDANAGRAPMNKVTLKAEDSRMWGPKAVIDWDKPVSLITLKGVLSNLQVRVLCHGVRNFDYPDCTTLVAIAANKRDILVRVNPKTGEGRSVNHVTFRFCNTPEKVKVNQFYANYYHHSQPSACLLECFDTRQAADDNNIFTSRDCCVRISIQNQPGGNWTASAEVV